MPDLETVLVAVYVLAADFCAAQPPSPRRPGPPPALSDPEVLTLAPLAAHTPGQNERAFWRFAERRLRDAFPTLPCRTQFNRQRRRLADLTARFALALVDPRERATAPYEILDGTAWPTRNVQRRAPGWLAGVANRGWSSRLGWFTGFRLLLAVTPAGTVTGFGVGPASTPDRSLADTLLAARATPVSGLPGAGQPASGGYLADSGFFGRDCQARWRTHGAIVRATPHPRSRARWSAATRRWMATHRQIVETVIGRMVCTGDLERSRPHALDGALARLASTVSWHNATIWLNRWQGRPLLTRPVIVGRDA